MHLPYIAKCCQIATVKTVNFIGWGHIIVIATVYILGPVEALLACVAEQLFHLKKTKTTKVQ